MYTKRYLSSYTVNGQVRRGCNVDKRGQKYVTLLICSTGMQDRGLHVNSWNPKDVAKCTDGEGNWLADEVIDTLPEETFDNFEKVTVPLDGIYNRLDNNQLVIGKDERPVEYTTMTVGVIWSERWDYLFVDGKPFINPVTGMFDKYPISDPATGRPKRFYDQGWSPEERVASMIEGGFYIKATTPATSVLQPNPAQQAASPAQQAAAAALAAAQQAAQAQQPAGVTVQQGAPQPTM